jgi:hypothetical protein
LERFNSIDRDSFSIVLSISGFFFPSRLVCLQVETSQFQKEEIEELALRDNQRVPPGFAEIESASRLSRASSEWLRVMRETLKLPGWMTPAAQQAIGERGWRTSGNPIGYIRTATYRIANRLGLVEDDNKGGKPWQCPCGQMSRAQAKLEDHRCRSPEVPAAKIKLPPSASSVADLIDRRHDPDDSEGFDSDAFVCVDADGETYVGSPMLWDVRSELIGLRRNSGTEHEASIDWEKVAEIAGLSHDAGRVMDLRFRQGLSREQVLENAPGRKRLRFQAAWREIDRHWDMIDALIRPPASSQRDLPNCALHADGSRSPLAPPVRRTDRTNKPPEGEKLLKEIDERFGTDRFLGRDHLQRRWS